MKTFLLHVFIPRFGKMIIHDATYFIEGVIHLLFQN